MNIKRWFNGKKDWIYKRRYICIYIYFNWWWFTFRWGLFYCKKEERHRNIIQRTLENGITDDGEGKYTVRIAPENTEKLQPGSYLYDLEIRDNQDVLTPLKGTMKLAYDITYEEE